MGTLIEHGPSTADKAMYWGLGLLMVAFIISVPFMVRDNNRLLEQQWQTQGCEMYDDYYPDKIPAKCSNYFTDHYKPQATRIQPPRSTP